MDLEAKAKAKAKVRLSEDKDKGQGEGKGEASGKSCVVLERPGWGNRPSHHGEYAEKDVKATSA